MFSCVIARCSASRTPPWTLRYSSVCAVIPGVNSRCSNKSRLHDPQLNTARAHTRFPLCIGMASPIDLTASDDDEGTHHKRAKFSHPHVQTTQNKEETSNPAIRVRGPDDAARAAIMGQARQANQQSANPLLSELAAARRAREAGRGTSEGSTASEPAARAAPAGGSEPQRALGAISILSYNIWFSDLAMQHRMDAIGEIIMEKGYPTVLCLQEVTPESYEMMRTSPWFGRYMASPFGRQSYDTAILYNKSHVTRARPFQKQPFDNSRMGRSVLDIALDLGGTPLRCATVHLESPVPGALASAPRKAQLSQVLEALDAQPEENILLAGDMNWNDDKDGRPQLSPGWRDVWAELKPGDPGYTYDGRGNAMLSSGFRTRLDRVFAKLVDWEPESIEMVGQEAIPGLLHTKVRRGKEVQLPVLPSDHYGLLLRLRRVDRD